MEDYTLDHIYWKILRVKRLMHTKRGRELSEEREKFVISFLKRMEKEMNGEL